MSTTANVDAGENTSTSRRKYMRDYQAKRRAKQTDQDRAKAARSQFDRHSSNIEKYLLRNCRQRAKRKNIECSISPEDLVVPEVCPVLGIPIYREFNPDIRGGISRPNAPSVDRVDNSIGYVKGNVRVISSKANLLKGSMSSEEARQIAKYIEEHKSSQSGDQ
jgi:hypothetical protein